ncbi:MAG TPA: hypothetical protein PK165_06170, partial [bacterium]|nr:hypothetical protein [bacterium]
PLSDHSILPYFPSTLNGEQYKISPNPSFIKRGVEGGLIKEGDLTWRGISRNLPQPLFYKEGSSMKWEFLRFDNI